MSHADIPKLWLPSQPAIVRPAEHSLLRPGAFRTMTREERRATLAELVRVRRLTPDGARQAILFTPVAGWVPGAVPVTTTFASAGSSASSASSFTLSISGMLTTGYRIIGVLGRGSSTRTINSVTLDGVAATALSSQISNSGTSGQFFIVAATANATANAVVSLSGAWTACAIGVWNVRNLASTAASDTVGSDTTYSSNQLSASVNVLAGGAVYAIAYDSHNGGPTFTWTGLTEAFDLAPGGSSPTGASGANADFSAAQTGLTVTAQGGSGASVGVLIVVPMR